MTKDEWFAVYQLFHPDADREEFSKEWEEELKILLEHQPKMLVQ